MTACTLRRCGITTTLLLLAAGSLQAASLTPTRAGMMRQIEEARRHGVTYAENMPHVHRMVRSGELVRVPGNRNYAVASWVHPYALPESRLFIERLSSQYRAACGEQLVVTSLMRPRDMRLPNSHPQSVHPTGMAIDLRVPQNPRCQSWLEMALINLERSGVLFAARERNPPHYHVVVFPSQYARYVSARTGQTVLASTGPRSTAARATHRVRQGESLWVIARRHGVTVAGLRRANGLSSDRIHPGQVLTLPAR
jgi:hypothetical protein